MLTLERAAVASAVDAEVVYSTFGYCITPDGTVYALCKRFYHGVVFALLYPEAFAAYRAAHPDEDGIDPAQDYVNVFAYQRWISSDEYRAVSSSIEIALSPLTDTSVRLPPGVCTDEQLRSLIAVCDAMGINHRDKLITEYGDYPLARVAQAARQSHEERWAIYQAEQDVEL